MQLAPPTIIGTLTDCCRVIRLQGQFTGATLFAQADGAGPITLGVASWPDEFYTFPPGVTFAPGSTVRVRQVRNVDSSEWSSDANAVKVQAAQQPPPIVATPFVGCGAVMEVQGLAAGALVTVTDTSGTVVGKGGGAGETADIELTRSLNIDEVVRVRADACGHAATILSPPAEPFPKAYAEVLKPPTIDPLYACQRVIVAHGLPIGGWLMIERNGVEHSWRSFTGEIRARVDPPLTPGEGLRIWARANTPCYVQATTPLTYVVPSTTPGPPSIGSDLCRGTKRIVISSLVPSAEVHITRRFSNDVLLAFVAAEPAQAVDLAGLDVVGGDELTVSQGLCGIFSAPSPVPAHVLLPADHIDPFLFSPAVACARALEIGGLTDGSTVQVFSALLNGLIGVASVTDDRVIVNVSPSLFEGDTLTIVVDGCASATLQVNVTQDQLRGPIITRAVEGELGVRIVNATPGSTVDIKDGKWTLVSTVVTRKECTMSLALPLPRTVLHAHARLCDRNTDGPSVDVKPWRVPFFAPVSTWGKQEGGKWVAGRVQAILPLPGGTVLAGTEASGMWLLPAPSAAGAAQAESLSMSWADPHVLCISAGVHGTSHVYVGTASGLWETDTTAPDPLRTWNQVAAAPGVAVHSILVLAGRNLIVIATNAGIHWSTIPSPGAAYTWQTIAPVDVLAWLSLTAGPAQSIVAYRPPSAQPAAVFVGTWIGSVLSWSNQTPAGPPGSELAQVAARMTNGALASCAGSPGRVYLAVADTAAADGSVSWLAVLRSENGGKTWTKPYSQDLNFFKATLGWQAERNLAIAVHPIAADVVLLGARRTGLLGSTNGGVDWDSGRWNERTGDFHADVLCVVFDPTDPTGNRVWSGGDGGLFVSADQGVNWDSLRNSRFPTLMFGVDGTPATEALGVNPSPAHAHVIVGALQDNGIAVLNGLGASWGHMYGGDGQRTVWVGPDVLFVSVNDDEQGDPGTRGLRWRVWNGGGFGGEHFSRPDAASYTPTLNFIPILEVIPYPIIWRDGGLLVALATDDRSSNGIFGLVDQRPGTADDSGDRFRWVRMTAFGDQGRGIGSFSGRHILVSGGDWIGAGVNQLYLLDSANVPIVRSLPPGISGTIRFPEFLSETSAVAVCDSGILYSPDLRHWQLLAAYPDPGIVPDVLMLDRGPDPAHLYVGTVNGVWISRNLAQSWEQCGGLPRIPQVTHLSSTPYPFGRFAYVGTWNWSAWKAELI
jgi:hypothetical protein